MTSKSKQRNLTEEEIELIINNLDPKFRTAYDSALSHDSIEKRREEYDDYVSTITELLQNIKIDTSITGNIPEKIKTEIIRLIETIPAETKEVPQNIGFSTLTNKEIETIISIFDSFYGVTIPGTKQKISKTATDTKTLYLPRFPTLWEITESLADTNKEYLRKELKNIVIEIENRDLLVTLIRNKFYEYYVKSILAPGTAIGSITAQNVGETITQQTLNVHKAPGVAAARAATAGMSRSEQIYEHSTPETPSCTIYYTNPLTYEKLKRNSYKLTEVYVISVLSSKFANVIETSLVDSSLDTYKPSVVRRELDGLGIEWHDRFDRAFPGSRTRLIKRPPVFLRLTLNSKKCYEYRVSPAAIADAIERNVADTRCLYTPLGGFPLPSVGVDVVENKESSRIVDAPSNIRRTRPVVDVYIKIPASTINKSFEEQSEYIRGVHEQIIGIHINGIPGIKSVFPYYTPIVRFFTTQKNGNNFDFIMDRALMLSCGVKSPQIVNYINWRLGSLGLTKTIGVGTKKAVVDGISYLDKEINDKLTIRVYDLSQDESVKIKNYGGIEPLTTFSRLIADEPASAENNKKSKSKRLEESFGELRRIELELDNDRLKNFGIEKSGQLVGLLLQELQLNSRIGEKYELNNSILVMFLRREKYKQMVKDSKSKTVSSTTSSERNKSNDLEWNTELNINVSICIPGFNQWSNQTIGSNLRAILSLPGVDVAASTTDNPKEIVELFGIEAHRNYAEEELNSSGNISRSVDLRNFSLIADTMTRSGIPLPMSRHGIAKQGTGPVSTASLEQASKHIQSASIMGEHDTLETPTSRILAGLRFRTGTDFSDVKLVEGVINTEDLDIEEEEEEQEKKKKKKPEKEREKKKVRITEIEGREEGKKEIGRKKLSKIPSLKPAAPKQMKKTSL